MCEMIVVVGRFGADNLSTSVVERNFEDFFLVFHSRSHFKAEKSGSRAWRIARRLRKTRSTQIVGWFNNRLLPLTWCPPPATVQIILIAVRAQWHHPSLDGRNISTSDCVLWQMKSSPFREVQQKLTGKLFLWINICMLWGCTDLSWMFVSRQQVEMGQRIIIKKSVRSALRDF